MQRISLGALIIALGLTLVATAGEMDLSFPSVVAFASYVFAFLFQQYDMTWLALIAALATGTAMGFVNGLVVTKLGIPSMIATLAMMFLWGGLLTVVSNGLTVAIPDIDGTLLQTIMVGRVGGIVPMQMIWAIAISIFVWQLLNRHRFGENILFIGDSIKVAKVVGIQIDREKIKLFTLMGFLSALAGVFLTVETTTYFNQQGQGYLLTVIAAVFIGGTSIFGGRAPLGCGAGGAGGVVRPRRGVSLGTSATIARCRPTATKPPGAGPRPRTSSAGRPGRGVSFWPDS